MSAFRPIKCKELSCQGGLLNQTQHLFDAGRSLTCEVWCGNRVLNKWINKEDVADILSAVSLSHKEEQSYVIFRKMDGARDHKFKGNKPDSCLSSLT